MSDVSLQQLRHVALVASHVRGVRCELRGAQGEVGVIGRRPEGGGVHLAAFRAAVASAVELGSVEPVARVVGFASGPPVEASLKGSSGLHPLERGLRWRRTCVCGPEDYLVSDFEPDDTRRSAIRLLADGVPAPERILWTRYDEEFRATILRCGRPPGLDPAAAAFVEQALRHITMMCRVGRALETS